MSRAAYKSWGRPWSEYLARVIWGLLAALHVLPFWRTIAALTTQGASLPRLGTLLVLAVFLALFALKALGVGFLRVRCGWMPLIVCLVCFGFFHGEDLAGWSKNPAHHVATLAVLSGAGTGALAAVKLRRPVSEFLRNLRDSAASPVAPELRVCFASGDARWRAGPDPGRRPGVPRGPPVRMR